MKKRRMRSGKIWWYLDREVPGLGRVCMALGTQSKQLARKRETMLLDLAANGRLDLVRGVLDGRVGFAELAHARDTDRTGELTNRLDRCEVRLRVAVEAALAAKEPDVRASTLARYWDGLRHLLAFAGDDSNVADALTTDRVQAFKAHRLREEASRETLNNDLIAVSILATYALRQGWITERPRVKKFKSKERVRWLEPGTFNVYMAALRPPFRPFFELLAGTGLRLGVGLALRVCDLRFGSDEAWALIEQGTKTETGVRSVFLPEWVADTLRALIGERGLSGQDRVFGHLKRRTTQKEHKRACELAGISNFTIHDFRHHAAVHLAKSATPLHLMQRQLGHKDIATTMKYAAYHPQYSDLGPYFRAVGRALAGDTGNGSRENGRVSEVKKVAREVAGSGTGEEADSAVA